MTYAFDDFKNIRTFPANTRVYRDGVFAPEISSPDEGADLPLHIIHIGNITGMANWFIDINDPVNVFLTARIETSGATKLRIEINPNLENIGFDGKLIIRNTGGLDLEIIANNNRNDTKIRAETKLFAAAGSENHLVGLSNIPSDITGAETDISFRSLCDRHVKLIEMSPAQRIASVPKSAEHSASIYRPAPSQIKYLETAGLSDADAADLLGHAFMEEIID